MDVRRRFQSPFSAKAESPAADLARATPLSKFLHRKGGASTGTGRSGGISRDLPVSLASIERIVHELNDARSSLLSDLSLAHGEKIACMRSLRDIDAQMLALADRRRELEGKVVSISRREDAVRKKVGELERRLEDISVESVFFEQSVRRIKGDVIVGSENQQSLSSPSPSASFPTSPDDGGVARDPEAAFAPTRDAPVSPFEPPVKMKWDDCTWAVHTAGGNQTCMYVSLLKKMLVAAGEDGRIRFIPLAFCDSDYGGSAGRQSHHDSSAVPESSIVVGHCEGCYIRAICATEDLSYLVVGCGNGKVFLFERYSPDAASGGVADQENRWPGFRAPPSSAEWCTPALPGPDSGPARSFQYRKALIYSLHNSPVTCLDLTDASNIASSMLLVGTATGLVEVLSIQIGHQSPHSLPLGNLNSNHLPGSSAVASATADPMPAAAGVASLSKNRPGVFHAAATFVASLSHNTAPADGGHSIPSPCTVQAIQCARYAVVTGCSDGNIRMWDLRTQSCIRTLRAHSAEVLSLMFDHRYRWLVTSGADGHVKLWDLGAERCIFDHIDPDSSRPRSAVLLSHGIAYSSQRNIRLLSVSLDLDSSLDMSCADDPSSLGSARLLGEKLFRGAGGHINAVLAKRPGHLLFAAASDGAVRAWSLR